MLLTRKLHVAAIAAAVLTLAVGYLTGRPTGASADSGAAAGTRRGRGPRRPAGRSPTGMGPGGGR